jgi:hypothetical protein
MKPKNKAIWVGGVVFILTLLATILKEREIYNIKALWVIWICFSWNFYAYGFDKGMVPRAFTELDGQGKGKSGERTFWFWATAAIYLAFLGVYVFAK